MSGICWVTAVVYFCREGANKSILDTVSTGFGKRRIFLPEARQNAG